MKFSLTLLSLFISSLLLANDTIYVKVYDQNRQPISEFNYEVKDAN